MKILEITYQHRRDFIADFICEGCGNIERNKSGYDDRRFHDRVIPMRFRCKKCGKTREDLGIKGEFTPTKYPEGYQI